MKEGTEMKYSEFKKLNEISRGKRTVVDYTLFEMNLVRIIVTIMDTEDGTIDQKEMIPMKELIKRVLSNDIKIENPERLYAYNWSSEDKIFIGYNAMQTA